LDCAEEVALLRSALGSRVTEQDLDFDVLRGRMTLRVPHDGGLGVEEVQRLVRPTGLKAHVLDPEGDSRASSLRNRVRWVLCLLSGALAVSGLAVHAMQHGFAHALVGGSEGAGFPPVSAALYSLAAIAGAWFVLPRAWSALRRLRPDMNLLMVVAIIGAILLGEWFEAAAISFLFSFALLLESWSVDRARRAIERLLDLSPQTARVTAEDGSEPVVLPVGEVRPGSTVSVRPGERVPLDGTVIRGHSSVDQAPLTGESIQVPKEPEDEVFAGTVNLEAPLWVRVTRPSSDSLLARIIHMVEEAQARRAPSERWVERFALRYTPAMMALALAVAVLPPLFGAVGWESSIYKGLVVLVIACPCALVIATPVSIVASLAASARMGVLIKGGAHLEAVARVKAIAIDKTGTLTKGEPRVQRLVALNGFTDGEVLAFARALESQSNHPIAHAIVAHADQRATPRLKIEALRELPGRGAEGTVEDRSLWIGSPRLAQERDLVDTTAQRVIEEVEEQGLTAIVLGDQERVYGVVGVADDIRPQARTIVADLHRIGIRPVAMLTGDHGRAALRVAEAIGIDEMHAGLLPSDKARAIMELTRQHGATAMVGDGVNDAPALAVATPGIAMGAMGSDVAIETADVALMSDELSRIPWLIGHARRTMRTIRQNVVLALGAKALVLGLSAVGVASLWMAIAADMGASLLVIANALRLLRTGETPGGASAVAVRKEEIAPTGA
jgi:Cd2+/Zn2+-exporting ATPase